MSTLIIPGDKLDIDPSKPVVLGPGVYCDPKTQEIRPVNAGIERISENKKGQTVYVEYDSKRYIAAVGDLVIGTIIGSFSDSYKVSLSNFSNSVSLSYMAFPNASKKNRPTLKIGDLVYARVCTAEKELEAEIECIDSTTGQDSGFGLLEDGMVIDVPLAFARQLLFDSIHPLLKLMANRVQFEVALGVNGKIWIKAQDFAHTLACYRVLEECQHSPKSAYSAIIKKHFELVATTIPN